MWMSQSVNAGCKLNYDIKYHISLYSLLSFLCGYHKLLTQFVSYNMIYNTTFLYLYVKLCLCMYSYNLAVLYYSSLNLTCSIIEFLPFVTL